MHASQRVDVQKLTRRSQLEPLARAQALHVPEDDSGSSVLPGLPKDRVARARALLPRGRLQPRGLDHSERRHRRGDVLYREGHRRGASLAMLASGQGLVVESARNPEFRVHKQKHLVEFFTIHHTIQDFLDDIAENEPFKVNP